MKKKIDKEKFNRFKNYILNIEDLLNKYLLELSQLIYITKLNNIYERNGFSLFFKSNLSQYDIFELQNYIINVIKCIINFFLSLKFILKRVKFNNLKISHNFLSFLK